MVDVLESTRSRDNRFEYRKRSENAQHAERTEEAMVEGHDSLLGGDWTPGMLRKVPGNSRFIRAFGVSRSSLLFANHEPVTDARRRSRLFWLCPLGSVQTGRRLPLNQQSFPEGLPSRW